ncbi:hypothetical protein P9112_010009 [Eukaryota sp. TZLM1-RC]
MEYTHIPLLFIFHSILLFIVRNVNENYDEEIANVTEDEDDPYLTTSCNEVEFDSTNEELDNPHSPNSAQYVEPQNRLNVNLPSSPRSSLHIPLSALDKSLLVEHFRQNFAPNTVVHSLLFFMVSIAVVPL